MHVTFIHKEYFPKSLESHFDMNALLMQLKIGESTQREKIRKSRKLLIYATFRVLDIFFYIGVYIKHCFSPYKILKTNYINLQVFSYYPLQSSQCFLISIIHTEKDLDTLHKQTNQRSTILHHGNESQLLF